MTDLPQLKVAEPAADYRLRLEFSNGEVRLFDVRPYLDKGIFKELRDWAYFRLVRVDNEAVTWPHEQDFSPATLHLRSRPADYVDTCSEGKGHDLPRNSRYASFGLDMTHITASVYWLTAQYDRQYCFLGWINY